MRGKWVWISIAAVGVGIGVGVISMRRPRPQAAPRNLAAAVITTPEVRLSGTIRPQHVTGVAASVSGNVEAFLANVGDEVFEGQVLARIGAAALESEREASAHAVESAQEQVAKAESLIVSARMEASRAAADGERARMALDRAQKVYERQRTLHAAGATPRLTYEKAAQDYESEGRQFEIMEKAMRAANDNVQSALDQLASAKKVLADKSEQLEQAQGAFEGAEVRAPVDGLIVARNGDVGKPAEEAGSDLFQIATDIYALEVAVEPKPDVLKSLRPGQPALVSVPDLGAGGIPGVIKEIKDTQAIVEFNSTMPAIRPGMVAEVRLKVE